MRICLLAPASSVHTSRIAVSLAARGLKVTVATFHPGSIPGVEVLAIPRVAAGPGKLGYLLAAPLAKRLVAKLNPDILHAHYLSSYGAVGGWCRFHPFVVSAWGSDVFDFPRRGRLNRWLICRALDRADAILSTSRFMADEVGLYTDKDVAVTPFGVDTGLFRPDLAAKPGQATLIGSVKALEPQYGMDTVIRAFAELAGKKRKRSLRLEIVGRGSQADKLKDLAGRLALGGLVSFPGFIDHRELPSSFNRYSVAAFGSVCQESFGVSLLEAQACGVPVVASDLGGFREVVRDGETGLLVPPGDHRAMAAAIGELLGDERKRKRFARAAREFVVKEYPWDRTVDLLTEIYRGFCATGSRPCRWP
jgi:glycosyltransferase involved in cell wall biosynthesis